MADQPSLRRRFQFRLRTLMIVVTLLTVSAAGWTELFRPHVGRSLGEDINLDFASFVIAMTSLFAVLGLPLRRPWSAAAFGLLMAVAIAFAFIANLMSGLGGL
jgi:hypothetical protein